MITHLSFLDQLVFISADKFKTSQTTFKLYKHGMLKCNRTLYHLKKNQTANTRLIRNTPLGNTSGEAAAELLGGGRASAAGELRRRASFGGDRARPEPPSPGGRVHHRTPGNTADRGLHHGATVSPSD